MIRKSRDEVIVLRQLITRRVLTQKHSVVTCRVHKARITERERQRDRQCAGTHIRTHTQKKLGVSCEYIGVNHRNTKARKKLKRMQKR